MTVSRITLPSGKVMEVYRQPQETRELHICRDCESELVQIVDHVRLDNLHFLLRLNCPNCNPSWDEKKMEIGRFSREQVEQLEARLDDGDRKLAEDHQTLYGVNMRWEIPRFVGALDRDAILVEDF